MVAATISLNTIENSKPESCQPVSVMQPSDTRKIQVYREVSCL